MNKQKTLKFVPELSQMIVAGRKSSTWRIDDDKDLQVGDEVVLINNQSMVQFGLARLTDVYAKPLGALTEADRVGHEGFADDEDMYQTYTRYYHRPVGPETEVKIVRFELIED